MAHADVDKLLGGPGVQCSITMDANNLNSTIGTVYRWGNRDGSFLQIPFTSSDKAHLAMFFK